MSSQNYIIEANNYIEKLSVFDKLKIYNFKLTTKKELDKQYKLCIDYILDYIKNNLGGENGE